MSINLGKVDVLISHSKEIGTNIYMHMLTSFCCLTNRKIKKRLSKFHYRSLVDTKSLYFCCIVLICIALFHTLKPPTKAASSRHSKKTALSKDSSKKKKTKVGIHLFTHCYLIFQPLWTVSMNRCGSCQKHSTPTPWCTQHNVKFHCFVDLITTKLLQLLREYVHKRKKGIALYYLF